MCAQLHLLLCSHRDCSWPGSSVHGIFPSRILELVATSYSRGSSQPRDQTCVSCVSWIDRRIIYHYSHLGSPDINLERPLFLHTLVFTTCIIFLFNSTCQCDQRELIISEKLLYILTRCKKKVIVIILNFQQTIFIGEIKRGKYVTEFWLPQYESMVM